MFNANNYGYNPYGTYIPQRPMQPLEQPVQATVNNMQGTPVVNRPLIQGLNGKQVESIDVVKSIDIPLDGTTSYFPIADGSAIVTKGLQMDGKSKTLIYRLVEEETEVKPQYITIDDLNNAFNDFKADIKKVIRAKKDDKDE